MKYLTIQGRQVPTLGFGTWQLRGRACVKAVEHALSLGYRHLDTAQSYENEDEVGAAIQNTDIDRGDIFLVTKIQPSNFARRKAIKSTERSLKKLKTVYIDLLLMHWPSDIVPLQETLEAMVQLQQAGKIRHIGVSNFSAEQVVESSQHATMFCNQVKYHPYQLQDELLVQAREMDYPLTAYSPLALGKVSSDDTLIDIGKVHGKTASQVTLRWLIQQENVAAIPKAASKEHQASNFDIFDFELSEEEVRRVSGLRRD